MTPTHHGLGSVVLCTVGGRVVAVDMRHVAGTNRVAGIDEDMVDLAPRLGLSSPGIERVLQLKTPAGRVSLGVEKVSQPLDTSERIPLSTFAGAEPGRHFEAMAQVNGHWYLVLDVRPFTGGSAVPVDPAAMSVQAPARGHAGRPRPQQGVASRRARPPGRLLGRDRAGERHPLAYALSAAQVVEVTFIPDIVPIPLAPAHVRGLCDWRNRPLVVVDLPARLMTDQRQPRIRNGSSSAGAAARATCSACSPPPISRWCASPSLMRRRCGTSRSTGAALGRSSTSARPRWSCPT